MALDKSRTLDANIREAKSRGNEGKVPAVPKTKEEDTNFLNELKKNASDTSIQIVRWTSRNVPAAGTGAAKTDENAKLALVGLTAVVSDLEVFGPYENVRSFVIHLESAPRLLNMNNVSWHRGVQAGTRLSMTLTRYVSEPTVGSATVASQATASEGMGGKK